MKNTFCACPWYKGAHTCTHAHTDVTRLLNQASMWQTIKINTWELRNLCSCVKVPMSDGKCFTGYLLYHIALTRLVSHLTSGLQLILPCLHPDTMIPLSVVYGSLLSSYSRCLHKAVSKRHSTFLSEISFKCCFKFNVLSQCQERQWGQWKGSRISK